MLESIAIAYSLHHHAHSSRHPAPDAGSQSTNVGKKTGFFARTSHVQNDATANIGQPDKAVSPPQNDAPEKKAFTLAEVLITLGIIGIVAAMTLPAIISKTEEHVLKTQFKKYYSAMVSAHQKTLYDMGGPAKCYYAQTNSQSIDCDEYYEKFLSNLKIARVCKGQAKKNGCLPEYNKYAEWQKEDGSLGGCNHFSQHWMETNAWIYVLNDGSIFIPYAFGLPFFAIDINGMKGPNEGGKDLFTVMLWHNTNDKEGVTVFYDASWNGCGSSFYKTGSKTFDQMLNSVYSK